MKSLSEALTDLARRVKRIEDSAAAVRERNDAALQIRCKQLKASIDRQVKETKHSADETRGAVSTWSEIKASLEHQVAAMRADYGDCAHLVERNPDKAARDAEQDAAAAITLASYCLDAAEWAVVRAELVRAAGHAGPRGGTGITAMEAAKLFSRRRCVFQGSSLHPTAAAQAER